MPHRLYLHALVLYGWLQDGRSPQQHYITAPTTAAYTPHACLPPPPFRLALALLVLTVCRGGLVATDMMDVH